MKYCILFWFLACFFVNAQSGLISKFDIAPNDLALSRKAQPMMPFDKVGHQFAILGQESGRFEAWAYPLKLFRNFEFSFYLGDSTSPIRAADVAHEIRYSPATATIRYVYQSFTVDAIFLTPPNVQGAIILLDVNSDEPLTISCAFLPVMQPMWPAGIGGQSARWLDDLKAYQISEPTRKNNAYLGSPAASGISYTPAHMLSDVPNEFQIKISDPKTVKNTFIPIVMAGGQGTREDIQAKYKHLLANAEMYYRETRQYYAALRQNTLQITTPDASLNTAFEWAKVSYDNLMVDHPTLGRGMIAGLAASGTSGRPGFGWFFGGDTFINSMSLNAMGATVSSKEALKFMHQFQRADGKMAHEITQAVDYVNWFKDYPYGYIHGDTSPYFIDAVYDYVRQTGDLAYLNEAWPVLQKAYDWTLATDKNDDGLPDNKEAGLGALEFGAMTKIQTDIYVAGVWARAAFAMNELAKVLNKPHDAFALRASKAASAFNDKFWDADMQQYAYAFGEDGGKVKDITPWASVGLIWNLGQDDRADATLSRLSAANMSTDWGIRMLSSDNPNFEPLNYNYGSVWPFLTSWVATAQYKHKRGLSAFPLLKASANLTFKRSLGHLPEVLSGSRFNWHQESVSHQGFCAASVVLPFVRGLVGLEGNALDKSLTFAPNLPANWPFLKVAHYVLGTAVFDLEIAQSDRNYVATLSQKSGESHRLNFAPILPLGTKVKNVKLNGKNLPFQSKVWAQGVQIETNFASFFASSASQVISIEIDPSPALVAPSYDPTLGDENQGMKIISEQVNGQKMRLEVEGLAGKTYVLNLEHANLILNVEGAVRKNNTLEVTMPKGTSDTFVKHFVEWTW